MLALSMQSWVVAGVIAAAVAYLGWYAWRWLRGGSCCESGCSSAQTPGMKSHGAAGGAAAGGKGEARSTPFIPADNLTDLARRLKDERAAGDRERGS